MSEPVQKVAVYLPITEEMIDDGWERNTMTFRAEQRNMHFVETMFDRMLRPWAYFGVTPWPAIDLFPRITNATRRITNVRQRVRRLWGRLPIHQACTLDHDEDEDD